MFYQTLADLVALIHFAFIVFAILGGLLALRWHWVPWAHIPAVVWGTMIELFGCFCPLTPLENSLRRAGGSAEYLGGFIERYLMPLIYPEALTRELQLVLGGVLVAFNLVVYLVVWRRFQARKASR